MNDKSLTINTIRFDNNNPLIIAEIGTGHGGDEKKGAELVAAAIEAGADCVKFQHVYADEIIHPETGLVPLPGGPVRLYDRFKALETGPDFMASMKELTESLGAIFLCTPFGLRSARELRDIGVSAIKIASPELNYIDLLNEIAGYHIPVILSSGVSTLSDIEAAIRRFDASPWGLAVLHCVTAYPAPETEYNLRVLAALATLFGIAVGVSDHSLDPVLVPALAVASGASIVEKHICLSRQGDGLDDPIALDPASFANMAQAIKKAGRDGPEATIAAMASEYGAGTVEAVLGDGIKRLAQSESANYERTNRSIHALRPIARGERFYSGNTAMLRTEKVLRPGLHPRYAATIEGRLAARDIPDGEGVEWADVGGF